MMFVVRIGGRCKKRGDDVETLNRLNLDRKFTGAFFDEKDSVINGMVESVAHLVAFGKLDEKVEKEMMKKKTKEKNIFHLHPPRGGFKKSSKVAYPKGILGRNPDLSKLVERML